MHAALSGLGVLKIHQNGKHELIRTPISMGYQLYFVDDQVLSTSINEKDIQKKSTSLI